MAQRIHHAAIAPTEVLGAGQPTGNDARRQKARASELCWYTVLDPTRGSSDPFDGCQLVFAVLGDPAVANCSTRVELDLGADVAVRLFGA